MNDTMGGLPGKLLLLYRIFSPKIVRWCMVLSGSSKRSERLKVSLSRVSLLRDLYSRLERLSISMS